MLIIFKYAVLGGRKRRREFKVFFVGFVHNFCLLKKGVVSGS